MSVGSTNIKTVECGNLNFIDAQVKTKSARWQTGRLIVNVFAHILIGVTIFLTLWYTCGNYPLDVIQTHIVLCVLGYQFLMSQGTLVLSNDNSWSPYIHLKSRLRLHWIVQSVSTLLIIGGSVLMIVSNTRNFTSTHGVLGISAMMLCIISVINGTISLFTNELRTILNAKWSKIFHIVTGIATLVLSSASLCYGFDNGLFRYYTSDKTANTLIGLTVTFTILVIMNPIMVSIRKIKSIFT